MSEKFSVYKGEISLLLLISPELWIKEARSLKALIPITTMTKSL